MEGNWTKKLLSMFLVLALCLSMIPTSAMAEEAAGGSAAVAQEELTTGDPAGAAGGSADAADDPAGANENDADSEGGKDDENGSNGENGASTPGESQTPGASGDKNGSVNGENDARNSDSVNAGNGVEDNGGTVENGDESANENDADPQDENENGKEAENGIVLLAAEGTVLGRYITGVEGYTNEGLPQSYTNGTVDCTELTETWLASNNYTLTDGWYVVQNSIGVYNKTLTINGTVHLIVGDYSLSIYNGSIHLANGSTLNVYGNNEPGWNEYLGISNIAGASTTNAFTCEGSATVHAYGDVMDVSVDSQATVLQSGVSLIIEPQMGLKLVDRNTNEIISESSRYTATNMRIAVCKHEGLKYVPSSIAGHEATSHQRICQDCGFITFGVDHEESHNWENGTCTDCGYECLHENLDADGACTVCGATFAAENTTTGKRYSSLKEALEAAKDNETVILLNNQSMESDAVLKDDVTVTLDLNGKTNNDGMIRVGSSNNDSFNTGVYELATLKLVGEGSLLQSDSRYAAISVYPGSTLDFSGWTGGEISFVSVNAHGGSSPITGTITGDIPANGKIGTLEMSNIWGNLSVILNGGSYGAIQVLGSQDIYAKDILASGYAFKKADGTFLPYGEKIENSNVTDVSVIKCNHTYTNQDEVFTEGTCNACGYVCPHEDANVVDGKCTVCGTIFAAQNTNTGTRYQSLNEALTDAADGSTIKVLTDNTMNSSDVNLKGKTVTLDLNGKTCHGNKSTIYLGNSNASEDATLELIGTGNLEQTKNESTIALSSIYVYKGSTLDLTGWQGGEIASITVNPGATIQTKDISGTIGELLLSEIPDEGGIALAGGSFGVIYFFDFNSATIKAGSLLAEGYAFKNEDGSMVLYDKTLSHGIDRGLTNVSVIKCSAHLDADNDTLCDYCNTDISSAAAKVTTTEGGTYYFMAEQDTSGAVMIDEAVTYANEHNDMVTLLAGDLTINNADCKIDLNGQTEITIRAGGQNLVVTDSGTNGTGTVVLLDTTSGSAKLYGGSYKQISTDSNTLGDLLPDGYGFKKAAGTWLTEAELATSGNNVLSGIDTVTVIEAPFESLSLKAPESITYTEDLTVTANVTPADKASTVTYRWYLDGTELTDKTAAALTLKDTPRSDYTKNPEPAEYGNAGEHTFKCVASSDGYVVSKEVTVTVKPADLANAKLTISGEDGLAYYPFSSDKDSGTELNVAYDLWYNNKYLTVQSSDPAVEPIAASDYTVTGNKGVINAGTYTLTVKGQGNYTGTKSVQFVVKPCELSDKASIGNLRKEYDGTTDLPLEQLDSVGFVYEGSGNTIDLDRGVDYTVERAQFENADVGDQKTVIIKFQMLNPNYSFAGGQREIDIIRRQQDAGSATQTIYKAAATDQSVDLKVMNGHAKTYTVDLAKLIPKLTAPKEYGDIIYGLPLVQLDTGYYVVGGAKVENGVLSLPIEQVDTDVEGKIGTVQVVVSTANYEDMTLTVNVLATNKLVPTGAPILSKSTLTYGEMLGNIKLSGSMKYEDQTVAGTFAWDTPDAKPDATTAYAAKWTFTPNDGSMYQTVNGTTEISVNKATPSGEPFYTRITAAGKTVTDAALAANPNWPAGTVKWVDADGNTLDDSTEVKANAAYQWVFAPTDMNNYNEATGTIVLYPVSSGGGSTGGGSTTKDDTAGGGAQTITVPVSSDHGDVHIEATVEGTTATVSVDNSQIDQVIADGAKTVTIDVSGLEGVDSVTLPMEIVSKTNEAKHTGLTVNLPDGAIALDQKALKTIAGGEDVTVSIQQAALTDAQRQAVGSLAQVAAVVDVDLYVGAKQQSRFGGGALTISIPYTPKKGEDTSNLAVWFIRDDGTIEAKKGSYDAESGCFVFKTKHLSRYLLVDITQTRTAANNSAKVGVWTQAVMFFRKFFGR